MAYRTVDEFSFNTYSKSYFQNQKFPDVAYPLDIPM